MPNALYAIMSLVFGVFSDFLIRTQILTLNAARKVFQGIGSYGAAAGLIWMSFVGCNPSVAVVALCIAVGFNGAVYSGCHGNHMDLSPNYAGTLMGIGTTLANSAGFLAPYYTGSFIDGNQTFAAWRIVFLTGAAVYCFTGTVFIIFSRGETQWWNTYWEHINTNDNETGSPASKKKESVN